MSNALTNDRAKQLQSNGESDDQGRFRGLSAYLDVRTVLTIIGLLVAVCGVVYAVATRETKEPIYAVDSSELVAQMVPGEARLMVLWDSEVITNAASVKIALWNRGSRYIDATDLSETDPIRLEPLDQVDILGVTVIERSRETLTFDARVKADGDGSEMVVITLVGDEALERLDGAVFHVLYSGNLTCEWSVGGRVKGAPEGFQRKKWRKIDTLTEWVWGVYGISVISIASLLGITVLLLPFTVVWPLMKGRGVVWIEWIPWLRLMGIGVFFFLASWLATTLQAPPPAWVSW